MGPSQTISVINPGSLLNVTIFVSYTWGSPSYWGGARTYSFCYDKYHGGTLKEINASAGSGIVVWMEWDGSKLIAKRDGDGWTDNIIITIIGSCSTDNFPMQWL